MARQNWAGSSSVVLLPPSSPICLGPDSIQRAGIHRIHGSALPEKPSKPAHALNVCGMAFGPGPDLAGLGGCRVLVGIREVGGTREGGPSDSQGVSVRHCEYLRAGAMERQSSITGLNHLKQTKTVLHGSFRPTDSKAAF